MRILRKRRGWLKYILPPCLTILGFYFISSTVDYKMELPSQSRHQYHWLVRPLAARLVKYSKSGRLTSESTPLIVFSPICDALIAGDVKQVTLTKQMLYTETRALATDQQMALQAHNCTRFWNQQHFSSLMLPSKEELHFPIAYIITIHKNVEQVVSLLRAIYAPQNIYCIHVDRKSPYQFYNAIEETVKCFPNVFICSKLEHVVYAGVSRLQADINCLKDLNNISATWKYAINLCGQDFPLKTNLDIVRYLIKLNGQNDIPGVIPPDKLHEDRVNYAHYIGSEDGQEAMLPTTNLKPTPPHNITIFFGSAYNILSEQFVDFVLKNPVALDLLKWMEDIYSPDENYWATLNRIPGVPGGSTQPSWDSLARAIKWSFFEGKLYPPCEGVYQRCVCIYGVGDLKWLTDQPHLFANKFDLDVDHTASLCLEYHLNKTAKFQTQFSTRSSINETDILKKFHSQIGH